MFRNIEAYVLKVAAIGIALATAIAIAVFSLNEFGYDRFHANAHDVFRVIRKNLDANYTGNRLSSKIDNDFIKTLTTQYKDSLVISRVKVLERVSVVIDGELVHNQKLHAVDTTIDHIFSLDIIDGHITTFKTQSNGSIIVSSEFAEYHWGRTNIAGEQIKVHTFNDTVHLSIAAVFRSFPKNSHEKFDLLMSFNTNHIKFLNFNPDETAVYGRSLGKTPDQYTFQDERNTQYSLQPITQIYFGPRVIGESCSHGDRYSIIIVICITSLIFFLAVTTLINLTTITLPYRSKELAVKKLAGVAIESLMFGFVKETCILVGLSLIISLVILVTVDRWINVILGFSVSQMIIHPDMTFILILAVLFATLTISPVFMTIKFVKATPNRLLSTDTITFPALKRYITFVQLGISIFLIISSVVINRQINYSLVKEPGQNHDQIVFLNSPAGITNEGINNLRNGWRKNNPNILDVLAISQLPDRISSKDVHSLYYQLSVDLGYRDFFNLDMIEGHWFGPNSGDSTIVLNKSANERFTAVNEHVLGVITDVNGLFNQAEKPTKFRLGNDYGYHWLCVRVLEVDIRRTVQRLGQQFSTTSEKAEVQYLSDHFRRWIDYQNQLNKLSEILAVIAAILSCCTIYALSISVVRDKLKQIGLHRLFGATTMDITSLLLRDFLRQLGIAVVVFLPISYFMLIELLRTFIYSTKFSWLDPIYPIAYCIVVITAICIVQAWNLKRTNSIIALKSG
ncbi:MAG TPA: FtsX-like permease family protein [Chryseosolibacter sp.]